jgi:hypothetical protein
MKPKILIKTKIAKNMSGIPRFLTILASISRRLNYPIEY